MSLAALERVVHTDPDSEPANLVCIPVDIDSSVDIESVDPRDLPSDWRAYPPPAALAGLGERWWGSGRTAVLSVPSVVIPHERNYLLNPVHQEFRRLRPGRPEPFSFDPRMWKGRRS